MISRTFDQPLIVELPALQSANPSALAKLCKGFDKLNKAQFINMQCLHGDSAVSSPWHETLRTILSDIREELRQLRDASQ